MITPDERVPQDDQQTSDKDEQRRQQDVHSNGFDHPDAGETDGAIEDESDALAQAYDAAEPSYTLNLDDEPKEEE